MKGENGNISDKMTRLPNFVAQETPLDPVLLIPVVIMFLGY